MQSLNKAQIIGNMTADAEIRETSSGKKVASFSVATNRKFKDKAGIVQEEVQFHNIVAWGVLSDIVERYAGKGKKVYIEGSLQTRSWDDKEGVKKYKTEIVAQNILILTPKDKSEDTDEPAATAMDGIPSFHLCSPSTLPQNPTPPPDFGPRTSLIL